MDKSRPGNSDPEIIDRPELKSTSRVLVEGTLTSIFWGLFIYWLSPLVTLLLWFFGIKFLHYKLIEEGGLLQFIDVLKRGGVIFLCILVIYLSWIYYNIIMYKIRGERRGSRVSITQDEDFAKFYHLDLDLLERAKAQPRLKVRLREGKLDLKESEVTEYLR